MCLLFLLVLLMSLVDNVVKRKHKSAHRVVKRRQVVSLDDDRGSNPGLALAQINLHLSSLQKCLKTQCTLFLTRHSVLTAHPLDKEC